MEEEIKKIIKEAERITLEANVDPSLRHAVFSEVFNSLRNSAGVGLNSGLIKSNNNPQPSSPENFWSLLAEASGTETLKLKDTFAIKDKQVFLVLRILPGGSKVDQRRNLSILILYAYSVGLGFEWLPATLLAEAAKNSKLYSSSHFAKNLKHEWFRSRGAGKGLMYKLSGPGLNRVKDLLKEIGEQT
jgi:hypothetical protein